jgi:capsid portal protein
MADGSLQMASRFAEAVSFGGGIQYEISKTENETTIPPPFNVADLHEGVEKIEDAIDCLLSYKTALILTQTDPSVPFDAIETSAESQRLSPETSTQDAKEAKRPGMASGAQSSSKDTK